VDAAASWYVAQTTDCTVLTWRNKDRVAINNQCRLKMGHQGELRVGEKLVILANRGSVCNGEVYAVTKIEWRASRWLGMDLCFVTLTNGQEILIDHQYLLRGVQTRNLPKSAVPVDFGYCLSVHKSQGSEWDAVCIAYTWEWMSRRNPDEWRRLTYTAVTRAKDSLIVMEV
jgi:exodeoxyribonuclease-5